jgi:hypothetical protein
MEINAEFLSTFPSRQTGLYNGTGIASDYGSLKQKAASHRDNADEAKHPEQTMFIKKREYHPEP